MSLILSLPVAPQAATVRANSQAARSDNQNKNEQNSFSAVFKRSQTSATSAEKAPEKTSVQRPPQNQNDSDKKSEPADPVAALALALAFLALEPRLTAASAGTATSAAPSGPASTVTTALGADANLNVAQLALAIPGQQDGDAPALLSDAKATGNATTATAETSAGLRTPQLALTTLAPQEGDAPDLLSDAKATGNAAAATTAETSAGLRGPQLAALAIPAPQDGDAPDLLSDAKATGNAAAAATATAETSAGLRAPQLAATDRVELTQVAQPAKSAAANMSTTAAGVIENQAMMSDTGATGQQSKQGDTATDSRDGKFNVKPDWRIETPMAASIAEATAATAAASKGNSVHTADQLDLSMATPNNPANVPPQLPAGAIQQTAAAAAPVSLPLAPPVGSSEWGDALGKQVAWMSNTNNQVAELQLNPAGLGPLKITLTINNHQAEALFVSAHPSVRAAVEAALPQLRNNLADNGISLGNTSVSADTQQQNAFAQGQDNQSSEPKYRADSVSTSNQGASLSMPEAAATATVSGNRNSVDIFA